MLIYKLLNTSIQTSNFLLNSILLYEVYKEENNCKEPYPQTRLIFLKLQLPLLEKKDFMFNPLLLINNFFCGLTIVVKQNPRLILVDVV